MDKHLGPSSQAKNPIGQEKLPSIAQMLFFGYFGAFCAGIGLFMLLAPEQQLIPNSIGSTPAAIPLIILGTAIEFYGVHLVMKRARIVKSQLQTGAGDDT